MSMKREEIAMLRRIQQEDVWGLISRLLNERIGQIKDEEVVGNTDFETLRMLHKNQGKVEGLAQFFEDLEKGAFQ
jgi:hypothetical protein